MKRFKFSLETVLNYKNQILDDLKREHRLILNEIAVKEAEIDGLEQEWEEKSAEFNQKKKEGIAVPGALSYSTHLRVAQEHIKDEYKNLDEIKKREESKRTEVVSARIETSSLEKLKEKRLEEHAEQERKETENFIEEFVKSTRAAAKVPAAT